MFAVVLKPRAEKEFTKLSRELQQKLFDEFKKLSANPFAVRGKKLWGTDNGYRLRIGRWRILFAMLDNERKIEVVDIFMKKGREDYMRKLKLFH